MLTTSFFKFVTKFLMLYSLKTYEAEMPKNQTWPGKPTLTAFLFPLFF